MHPLLSLLIRAAEGSFPSADGLVEVMNPLIGAPQECVTEFTGHAVAMTTLTAAHLTALRADGFGRSVHPDVLRGLAGHRGHIGCHDAVLAKRGGGTPQLPLRTDLDNHSRVLHARTLRRDVRVFGDERGVVCIGKGIADRWEISVEVDPTRRHRGDGRSLLQDGLGQLPEDEWCFAEVSPGNAASLRAFLAVGWVPIAAEVIYVPDRGQPG